jgi:hypothetical protein
VAHGIFHDMRFSSRGLWCYDCKKWRDPDERWIPTERELERHIGKKVRRPGETLRQAVARWTAQGLPAARRVLRRMNRKTSRKP